LLVPIPLDIGVTVDRETSLSVLATCSVALVVRLTDVSAAFISLGFIRPSLPLHLSILGCTTSAEFMIVSVESEVEPSVMILIAGSDI